MTPNPMLIMITAIYDTSYVPTVMSKRQCSLIDGRGPAYASKLRSSDIIFLSGKVKVHTKRKESRCVTQVHRIEDVEEKPFQRQECYLKVNVA